MKFIQDLTVVVSAANPALNFCFQLHKLPIFTGQLVLQHHGGVPGPRSSPHECLSSRSRVRTGLCLLLAGTRSACARGCHGAAREVQHHLPEPDGKRAQKGIPCERGALEHLADKIFRLPGTRLFFE